MAGYYEEWERRDAAAAQRRFFMIVGLVLGIGVIVRESMEDPPPPLATGGARASIALEKSFIDKDIAELQHFSDWMNHLYRIARDDPEEALRQRLPMARCRASVLAPDCGMHGMLFAPDILVPSKRPEMWFDRKEPGDQS